MTSADVSAIGSLAVTAVNSTPAGGTSSAISLPVNNPAPGTIQLSPSTLTAGGASPVTITVTGVFVPASAVQVNGTARPTTYVNATTLTFAATVTDQASVSILAVTVTNPAPGGGTSPVSNLVIGNPTSTPSITAVTPTSIVEGSGDTFITVTGTGFTGSSDVQWNGANLQTYFQGINFLSATVPAADVAKTGSANVTVTSPTATPSVSNAIQVNITNPPAPTLTTITPTNGPINTDTQVELFGTGFTNLSTVSFNGTNLPVTAIQGSGQLTVTIPASAIALPGNGSFTVTTPAPGGGTTAPLAYTAYIAIPNNSMVYNAANGLFYASVPSSAGPPYGNSIVSVDPATGALGTPIHVGSEPNKLAITSDGHYLWVGLDGASAVRQVDLTTGTAGLQFTLGGNAGLYENPGTALALAALPGSPNSVVVSSSNEFSDLALAIYDSGVIRGSGTGGSIGITGSANALQVDGTRGEVYAGSQNQYNTYTYSSTGLTPLASSSSGAYTAYTDDEMLIAGGKLYTDLGGVYDAESGDLLGTFYSSGTTAATGTTTADTTLGKAFILTNQNAYSSVSPTQIQIFNISNFTNDTTLSLPVSYSTSSNYSITPGPTRLTRWGADGLAFRTNVGIYSLRSSAVKDLSSVSADLGVTLASSGSNATGATSTFTATVKNAGPSGATSVALTALVPSTGTLVSATPSTGSCFTSSAVSCDLGSLANGSSATVTFVIQQMTAGDSTMMVQVSASENDPKPSNNQSSSTVSITGSAYNALPAIASISPATILAGAGDTEITVTGTGFSTGSSILLDGTPIATSLDSATQLTATVPASKLAALGWSAVSVSNAAPGGGTSSSLPLSVYTVTTLGVNHILYDPYSRNIMASVGSGSSQITGNSIVSITPTTSTISTPVPIGSQPTNMALTSDGQILYTVLIGNQSVARYNMLTQSADFTYQVPNDSNADGLQGLRGIAAQPGTENTVALDLGSWAGNAIFDFDPTNKTAAIRGQASGPYSGSCLQFLDAADLLAFDVDTSGATFDHYTVTSSGFTYYNYSQYSESTLFGFGCFKLSGGLAFANGGGVANPAPATAVQLGVFQGLPGGEFSTSLGLAPDASLQRVFFVATEDNSNASNAIVVYNPNTYLLAANIPLNLQATEGNTDFTVTDFVRWGQDGLAILTSGGHIYFLRGPAVVPGLLNQNTAANLSSSSTTTIAHGTGNTLLTLTGSNFLPGVAVAWNGNYRTTTIVDSTHVTVAIPASDLSSAGSGSLVATNPGAPASKALQITIN